MIIFKELKYSNFLSSGNNPTTIDLDSVESTLILGKNGSGKCLGSSTVLQIQVNKDETENKLKEFLKNENARRVLQNNNNKDCKN